MLDGPEIESRWGARFSSLVQTCPLIHPAYCKMGTGSFPGGKERPGRDADPSTPSNTAVKERVEVYLYSPYGPYGAVQSLSVCTGVHFAFRCIICRCRQGLCNTTWQAADWIPLLQMNILRHRASLYSFLFLLSLWCLNSWCFLILEYV